MKVLVLGSKALGLRLGQLLFDLSPSSFAGFLTFDDSADDRSALTELRSWCEHRGVELWVATDRAAAESTIASVAPDLCVVAGWYWLISEKCLAGVPAGFIGIHYSRLPEYRGSSPLVWQIINGEPEAWFSIFSFTPGMDEGDLWAQGSAPIAASDSIGELLPRLESAVVGTLETLYPAILRGEARPYPQPAVEPTYCAARLPSDGIIDFTEPARRCHDFIRAQSRPYPGAFTYLDGEKLIVWRARLSSHTYFGRPGQVARIEKDGVVVVCGDNQPVILETVGWRGSERPAAEVVRSVKIRFPAGPA